MLILSYLIGHASNLRAAGSRKMCSFLLTTLHLLNLTHANFYLKQRGPDHTSHLRSGGFTFVHNLLSQTGNLSAQPLATTNGDVLALFNGEVYNYRGLQRTLRPYGPSYPSDGASIMDAYQAYGSSSPCT